MIAAIEDHSTHALSMQAYNTFPDPRNPMIETAPSLPVPGLCLALAGNLKAPSDPQHRWIPPLHRHIRRRPRNPEVVRDTNPGSTRASCNRRRTRWSAGDSGSGGSGAFHRGGEPPWGEGGQRRRGFPPPAPGITTAAVRPPSAHSLIQAAVELGGFRCARGGQAGGGGGGGGSFRCL